MKNYFFNFLLTAIVAYLLAALSFLIGNEAGAPSVATATASGVFVGIATALSYCFGKLRAGAAFDWKELVVALVGGVGAGLLGGLQMGL